MTPCRQRLDSVLLVLVLLFPALHGLGTIRRGTAGVLTGSFKIAVTATALTPVILALHYSYDAADRRTGLTVNGQDGQSWGYDAAGRVSSLGLAGGGTATVTHDGAGTLTGLSVPNGGVESWGYDGAGRPISSTETISGTIAFSQTATLDAAGQRTALQDSWGRTGYGYDPAGRLVSASYPDGSSEADQYDAAGNRTVITGTTVLSGTQVTTNHFDAADQLTSSVVGGTTTTYSYDGDGNQTRIAAPSGATTAYSYNDLRQLVHVTGPATNASYVYDGQGDRLRGYEQYGASPTLRNDTQDLVGGMSSLASDGQQVYTYLTPGDGSAPVTGYNLTTTRSSYYAADLLGSVRLATDPSGATIGAGAYDAWGNYRPNTGSSGATQLAGLQATSPFGYAGQVYDAGPGTYSMRARQYDPAQGRFTSQDPQAPNPQTPVTIDPYAYAGNMPTEVTDPSGQGWVEQPAGSSDDQEAAAIQAKIRYEMRGAAQAGRTTEYNVPLYTARCSRPARAYNLDILSLAAGGVGGAFWDIEHVQAYTGRPGAAAIASGIRTHLARPLLQGAYIDWGANCDYDRVGNPYSGDTCTDVRRLRVWGVAPGGDYVQAFGLGQVASYALAAGGRAVTVHEVPDPRDPWGRLETWGAPGQAGLILYDRFRLTPNCATGDVLTQLACAYLTGLAGPGRGAGGADAEVDGEAAHGEGAPRAAIQREEVLALRDVGGGATLGEDLALARQASARVAGCSACFAAGTRVATPGGGTAIERLRVGDRVLAEDPDAGRVEAEAVQAVIDDGAKPLLELELADGSAIRVTANHDFWVDGGPGLAHAGWLQAGQLKPGDRLRAASGRDLAVVGLRWNVGDAEVYTLTVATDHTFFVGSAQVLVHNADCGDIHFEAEIDPAPLEVVNDRGSGNKLKDAWGEQAMDEVMASQGYKRIAGHTTNGTSRHGVDGIYRKIDPDTHPQWPAYVVGEAKYDTSQLGVQLEKWYLEERLFRNENPSVIDELYKKGYGRILARAYPSGYPFSWASWSGIRADRL